MLQELFKHKAYRIKSGNCAPENIVGIKLRKHEIVNYTTNTRHKHSLVFFSIQSALMAYYLMFLHITQFSRINVCSHVCEQTYVQMQLYQFQQYHSLIKSYCNNLIKINGILVLFINHGGQAKDNHQLFVDKSDFQPVFHAFGS